LLKRGEIRYSQEPREKPGLSKETPLSSQATAGMWWLWDALVRYRHRGRRILLPWQKRKGQSQWEGCTILRMSSPQLWDTQGAWGTDSAAGPVASKFPQPGRSEGIRKKLPKWEFGKFCKRGLILGEASLAMGCCLLP